MASRPGTVPHVLGVVARTDALHELAAVVEVRACVGRREAGEDLLAAGRVDVGVVIAAHVHPDLVVSPAPLRDVLLRHDLRQRQRRRRRRHDGRVGEERRLLRRRDLRGVWPSSELRAFTKSMCAEMPLRYAASAVALSPARYAASALMNCSCAYVMTGNLTLSRRGSARAAGAPAGAGVAEEVVRLLRRGERAESDDVDVEAADTRRPVTATSMRLMRGSRRRRTACRSCRSDDELRLAVRREVAARGARGSCGRRCRG